MSFIGENLKHLRTEAGMSMQELSIELDVYRSTISHWESGRWEIPDARIE